jgi:4-hydroxybenzoyl-CoA thioesterase
MAFRIRQPVRHPDVDRAGIVYFPRFYDFFHRALEDFFATEVGVAYWELEEKMGVAFPAVHIETDFERPLQHGDVVTVELETERVGSKSVTVLYRILRADGAEPAATSRIVLACIQVPDWRPTQLPEKIRAAFQRHKAA